MKAAGWTLCVALMAAPALAQDATSETITSETAARLEAAQKSRALTRPAAPAPAPGTPAPEIVEEPINWTEMRTEMAISARRDIQSQQTVTAVVGRPAGLRAASAERFQNVVTREVNLTRLPLLAPERDELWRVLAG